MLSTFEIIIALLYFVPTAIAYFRKHNNFAALFALNLLGGWTGVLWLAALVWALLKQPERA